MLLAVLLATLGGLLTSPASSVALADEDAGASVTLVLFHGEGCPHCAAERDFLADLGAKYPDLVVELHEVWNDEANRALLEQTAERMGFEPSGVPVTIIGEQVWIGFSDAIRDEIIAAVVAGLGATGPSPEPTGSPGPTAGSGASEVDVPLVGLVDVSTSSLLVATLVIGFVDGVNPCSLWVLSLLLAMVLNRGSRGRVLLVGSVFLAVTAGMYALYVVGFYTALDYVGGMGWIRLVVALIAMAFGLLQLKDGLRPGSGPSLSISPSARPRIYQGMRRVAAPERGIAATLAGTVALAVGVSLLETPCTAGLPLLWTGMLAEQGVTTAAAVGLFAVYMAVFLLDELIVFVAAVVTLRATRLQERHGRVLKILAGSFLVTLALAMLLAPDAMDTLTGTAAVLALAAGLTLILWLASARRNA